VDLGTFFKSDWWAFGSKDPSNTYLWTYSGVYFSMAIDIKVAYKYIKEKGIWNKKKRRKR